MHNLLHLPKVEGDKDRGTVSWQEKPDKGYFNFRKIELRVRNLPWLCSFCIRLSLVLVEARLCGQELLY